MEKDRGQEECGSPELNQEKSPTQEVLDNHGEILSCGGVYLAPVREPFVRREKFDFICLPNRRQEVMVLRNQQLIRVLGEKTKERKIPSTESSSPQETIRRFFREGLN